MFFLITSLPYWWRLKHTFTFYFGMIVSSVVLMGLQYGDQLPANPTVHFWVFTFAFFMIFFHVIFEIIFE